MSTSKKFAFRDIRTPVELLASARLPKLVTIVKKNPMPSKLRGLFKSTIGGALGRFALQAGTKAVLGPIGSKALGLLSGKVGGIFGKVGALAGKVTRAVNIAAYGARIVEELNPANIVRPQREGFSINPAGAAKQLSLTAAASVASSLLAGVPLANPIAGQVRSFKMPASLVRSPRFFNPRATVYTLPANTVAVAQTAVRHVEVSTNTAVLFPQRGLLEDEIFYRLVLIAENVYEPTLAYAVQQGFGSLTILEGFRSENSGVSAHERGEAIDFTVSDGSLTTTNVTQLYALAQWMRDNVLYDQLILCYSPILGGQVWIHVSMTPDARRRQVLTKPFNDVHMEGLHMISGYNDNALRVRDQATAASHGRDAQTITSIMAGRDTRLNPVETSSVSSVQSGTNPFLSMPTGSSTGSGGGSGTSGCAPGCVVVYPRAGLPTTTDIFAVANQVKAELSALGMTYADAATMGDWWTAGRTGSDRRKYQLYQQELMKMQIVSVVTARRLQRQGFVTLGLTSYTGASGNGYRSSGGRTPDELSYNDNSVNAFYDTYAARLVDGTPELPAGLLLSPDSVMISKTGPDFDFIISGMTIGVGNLNDSGCDLAEFSALWCNPFDGSSSNYPPAGTPGTETALTGCTGSGSGNPGDPGTVEDIRSIVSSTYASLQSDPNFRTLYDITRPDPSGGDANDNAGRFMERLVAALQSQGKTQWGLLRKASGQRQYNGHAVDAILFLGLPGNPAGIQYNGKTGTAVDLISCSKNEGCTASLSWGVDEPRYSSADWFLI